MVLGDALVPYVAAIAGSGVQVQGLLNPGQDMHQFALTPTQAEALRNADMLIVADVSVHPNLAQWKTLNARMHVLSLSELPAARPLSYPLENAWLASAGGKSQASPPKPTESREKENALLPSRDPHLWLDPLRMADIAVPLAQAMARDFQAQEIDLLRNAQREARHLRSEVMPALQQVLREGQATLGVDAGEIPYITGHAAYGYFYDRFGLQDYGEIHIRPIEAVGALEAAKLLAAAKKSRVSCLIVEPGMPLAQRLAEISHARIVTHLPESRVEGGGYDPDPRLHDGYDRLLFQTAQLFAQCLTHRGQPGH